MDTEIKKSGFCGAEADRQGLYAILYLLLFCFVHLFFTTNTTISYMETDTSLLNIIYLEHRNNIFSLVAQVCHPFKVYLIRIQY